MAETHASLINQDEEHVFSASSYEHFSELVIDGHISLKDQETTQTKKKNRNVKKEHIEKLLGCSTNQRRVHEEPETLSPTTPPSNPPPEITPQNTTTMLHDELDKYCKYIQREMTYCTRNLDPYSHLLSARRQLLEKSRELSMKRQQKFKKAFSKTPPTLEEKTLFLKFFFGYYNIPKRKEPEVRRDRDAAPARGGDRRGRSHENRWQFELDGIHTFYPEEVSLRLEEALQNGTGPVTYRPPNGFVYQLDPVARLQTNIETGRSRRIRRVQMRNLRSARGRHQARQVPNVYESLFTERLRQQRRRSRNANAAEPAAEEQANAEPQVANDEAPENEAAPANEEAPAPATIVLGSGNSEEPAEQNEAAPVAEPAPVEESAPAAPVEESAPAAEEPASVSAPVESQPEVAEEAPAPEQSESVPSEAAPEQNAESAPANNEEEAAPAEAESKEENKEAEGGEEKKKEVAEVLPEPLIPEHQLAAILELAITIPDDFTPLMEFTDKLRKNTEEPQPEQPENARGRAIASRLIRQLELGDESLNILSGGNAQNLERVLLEENANLEEAIQLVDDDEDEDMDESENIEEDVLPVVEEANAFLSRNEEMEDSEEDEEEEEEEIEDEPMLEDGAFHVPAGNAGLFGDLQYPFGGMMENDLDLVAIQRSLLESIQNPAAASPEVPAEAAAPVVPVPEAEAAPAAPEASLAEPEVNAEEAAPAEPESAPAEPAAALAEPVVPEDQPAPESEPVAAEAEQPAVVNEEVAAEENVEEPAAAEQPAAAPEASEPAPAENVEAEPEPAPAENVEAEPVPQPAAAESVNANDGGVDERLPEVAAPPPVQPEENAFRRAFYPESNPRWSRRRGAPSGRGRVRAAPSGRGRPDLDIFSGFRPADLDFVANRYRARQPELRAIDESRTETQRSQMLAERWMTNEHRYRGYRFDGRAQPFPRLWEARLRRREPERRGRSEKNSLVTFGDCCQLMDLSLGKVIEEYKVKLEESITGIKEEEKEEVEVEEEGLKDKEEGLKDKNVEEPEKKPEEEEKKAEDEKKKEKRKGPSPMCTFLLHLQRDLAFRAIQAKEGSPDVDIVTEYLDKLFSQAADGLKLAFDSINDENRDRIVAAIHDSFIVYAVQPVLTAMISFIYSPVLRPRMEDTLPRLLELFEILDDFSACENWQTHTICDDEPFPVENSVVVESPHYYPEGYEDRKNVSIPGADVLVLQFDPRCQTLAPSSSGVSTSRDELSIFFGDGTPLCPPMCGSRFPSTPLLICGNSLMLHFLSNTDKKRKYWGYKLTVTGLKMFREMPMPRMLDMFRTLSHLVGKCLRSSTIGQPVREQEANHASWLQSPLFSKGREDTIDPKNFTPSWSPCAQHSVFLQDLANQTPNTKALALSEHMATVVSARHLRKNAEAEKTRYQCIAVLIKHLGLVEIASKFMSIPEEVKEFQQPKLAKVWEHGIKINRWLFTQKDARLKAFETKEATFNKKVEKEEEEWKETKEKLRIIENAEDNERLKEKDEVLKDKEGDEDELMDKEVPESEVSPDKKEVATEVTDEFQKEREEALVARESQLKEREKEMEELAEEERLATMEGICEPIQRKIAYLLETKPIFSGELANFESPAFDNSLSLTLARTGSYDQVSNKEEPWIQAMNKWKIVHGHVLKKASSSESKKETSFPDILLSFIKSATTLEKFKEMIAIHESRAQKRIEALDQLYKVLTNTKCSVGKLGVLSEWKCPFREYTDYEEGPKGDHFLSHIQSCGSDLTTQITEVWENLYSYFAELVVDKEIDWQFRVYALDAWGTKLLPRDETFVKNMQVYERLKEMAEKEGEKSSEKLIQEFAVLTRRLFSMNCMTFDSQDLSVMAESMPQDICDVLQQNLDERLHVLNEKYKSLNAKFDAESKENQSDEYGPDPRFKEDALFKELQKVENDVYTALVMFRAMVSRTSAPTERNIADNSMLRLLMSFVATGSPRIERACLLMIGDYCPDIHLLSQKDILQCLIGSESKAVEDEKMMDVEKKPVAKPVEKPKKKELNTSNTVFGMLDASPMNDYVPAIKIPTARYTDLLDFLFEKIGNLFITPTHGMNADDKKSPFTFRRSAECRRNIGMAYVSFVRRLYLEETCRDNITDFILDTLKRSHGILDPKSSSLMCETYDPLFLKTMGILCVLGGSPDRLHTGCVVVNKGEDKAKSKRQEHGVCIDYQKFDGNILVKYENVKRPVLVKKDDVIASCKIPPPPNFLLNEDLLRFFKEFLEDPSIEVIKPVAPKSSEPEEPEDEPEEPMLGAVWECPRCTFVNTIPMLKYCDVCGGEKPEPKRKKKKEKKKEELWIPEEDQTFSAETLAFFQLRSVALKTLCISLENNDNVKVILNDPELLQKMIEIAVTPTDLDEYQSIETLQEISERLVERIVDKSTGIDEWVPSLQKAKTHREILLKSVYRCVPQPLPCKIDVGIGTTGVSISRNDPCRVRFIPEHSSDIGYCRSNCKIPKTHLHSYYFEVQIVKLPNADGGWGVAVGLWRENQQFEGGALPGARRSFAYYDQGLLGQTIGGDLVQMGGGVQFGEGDVVGVHFEFKIGRCTFTVNGHVIEADPFEAQLRDDQFYPMVWLRQKGVEVDINYGQRDFIFPYDSTLPDGFVADLEHQLANLDTYSEVEAERYSKAQNLSEITGFPVQFCMTALERYHDDVQHACEWLFSKGAEEYEKMFENTVAISALDQNAQNDADVEQPVEEDDDDDNLWVATERQSQNQESMRWLDEDYQQTLPVGVTIDEIEHDGNHGAEDTQQQQQNVEVQAVRRAKKQRKATLPVRADKLVVGMILTCSTDAQNISSDWDASMDYLKGQSGILVSSTTDKVNMMFLDGDRGSFNLVCLPLVCVHHPISKVTDPLLDLNIWTKERKEEIKMFGKAALGTFNEVPTLGVQAHYVSNEIALSSLRIRRSVNNLIENWPLEKDFNLSLFGGLSQIRNLMLLNGAEILASGNTSENEDQSDKYKILNEKLQVLINEAKKNTELKALRLAPDVFKLLSTEAGRGELMLNGKDDNYSLNQSIVEEMLLHFLLAVNSKSGSLVYASAHNPYQDNIEKKFMVHIPGANRLLITFDDRTELSDDFMTSLSFYSDPQYNVQIDKANYKGRVPKNTFLIVKSNKFWVRFKTSNSTNHYGYRFKVKPLERRVDDVSALQGLNVEFGSWLAELVFEVMPAEVLSEYVSSIFDVFTHFCINVSTSQKVRGIVPLIRLMHKIRECGLAEMIDESNLTPLKSTMEEKMSQLDSTNMTMQSRLLQTVIELMAITQTMHPEYEVMDEEEKAEKSLDVDASDLYIWKITIKSAQLGVGDNRVDIVDEMNDLVAQYGHTWVRLPGHSEWENHAWFSKDPAKEVPLENKSINIEYEVYRHVFDPKAETENKIYREVMTASSTTVTNSSVFLRAEPSIFDNVVEISSLTLDTKSGYAFPGAFLSEVCRNSHVCENWYQVERPKTSLKSAAYPCPASSSFPVSSFSVSFWVYLKKAKADDGQRNILYKGDLSNGISPQIILEAGSNILIARATCKKLNREQYTVHVQSENLEPKHWYHIALTIDQLSLKLYINSHLVEKKRIEGSVLFNPSPIYLGDLPPGVCPEPTPTGFDGTTFDVRYYTRALREEEIKTYWQNTDVRDKSNEKTEINLPCTEYEPLTTKDLQNAWTGQTFWGSKSWTSEVDQQLMDLIEEATNEYCTDLMQSDWESEYETSGTTLFTATAHNLEPSKKIIDGYHLISNAHQRLKTMRTRFLMISMLNSKIDRVLPLVDFSQATQLNSLSWRICRLRSLIFMELKNKAWKEILNETSSRGGGLRLELNRPKALKARETRSDPSGKKSVFGQMFCQLHFRKPERLRTDIRPDHRPWAVSFSGEGAQDVGGPFRESLSVLSDDLQSDYLQLFIKCANSSGYGNNQEKFIPNPSCESSLQLAMYSFVGKMMGVAFRGKYYLNLDFASVIWKPLVGEKITRKDLQDIDQLFITQMEQFSEGTSEEHINSLEQTFVILSADGREIELKPGGKFEEVTWENKHEFVELAMEYKLNEFDNQVQAIRKGLGTIIPIQLLPMFTWQQLERLVCGKREIDVNLLRANTDYSRCRREDKHIKFFWRALEEMSHTQRQQFLRFVWGQSRLPTEQHWRHRFRIQDYQGGGDQTLPVSHTCFFSLELPRYSTFEALKKKLLYACANCEAIDTDFNADNIDWNE